MSTEKFADWNPKKETRDVVDNANKIITSYAEQGLSVTVRQLFYRLVTLDLFTKRYTKAKVGAKWVRDELNGTTNADPNYKMLKQVLGRARLAGLIDWDAIEDRQRVWHADAHYESPRQYMEVVTDYDLYSIDKWADQNVAVEVWVEKNALIGVLASVCKGLDVLHYACIGYNSCSMQYEAAKRFESYRYCGREPVVIYLGDHDPSGVDMTRDIEERLTLMSHGPVEVNRIALNIDQIEVLGVEPNTAKTMDSRAKDYIKKYGTDCWELDAIDVVVMADMIKEAVISYRDDDMFEARAALEQDHRKVLRDLTDSLE